MNTCTYNAKCESVVEKSVLPHGVYVENARIIATNSEDIPLDTLSPVLRTLLFTDGTVTKTLEAYYWEPINVDVLAQDLCPSEEAVSPLDIQAGEMVLIRGVQLYGVYSGNIYATASSVVRANRIPKHFLETLTTEGSAIGNFIRNAQLESYREILKMGMSEITGSYNKKENAAPTRFRTADRTYRILLSGTPAILITERFPLPLYC